jgi:energy-coupling factor transporter ATP-binding protein EcfA2
MDNKTGLRVFDFTHLFKKDSFVLAIIGSSGHGKTTLLKHMLHISKEHYTNVFLFQGSAPSEENLYIDFIWPADIEYATDNDNKTYKTKFKNDILKYNTTIAEYNTDIRDYNKKHDKQLKLIKTLFIFDDFGPNNKYFSDFANVSRHSLSSFVFIIHNDTDLDLSFRKKITHFFVNVCFALNQIAEIFKDIKNEYEVIRKKFMENNQKKTFLVLDRDNPMDLYYTCLNEKQIEAIKNSNSFLYRFSKQRISMRESLVKLAQHLREEEKRKKKSIKS